MAVEKRQQPAFFKTNQQKQKACPEQKIPVRAVPDAGQHPDDEEVAQSLCFSAAASAKGDVDVVAEPGAKRHMPSAPEVRHGQGNIRMIEIIRQLESQHETEALCHEGIAVKIKIKLQAVGDKRHPGKLWGDGVVADSGSSSPQPAETVSQKHFEAKTDGKFPQATFQPVQGRMRVQEGWLQRFVAGDWPGKQLRKHREPGGKARDGALPANVSAGNINQITQRGKGVKADARRHWKRLQLWQELQTEVREQRAAHRQQRVCVFEEQQPEQVVNNAAQKPAPAAAPRQALGNPAADDGIYQSGQQKQRQHPQAAVHANPIKEQTPKQQAKKPQSLRNAEIDDQKNRQKGK